MSSIEGSTLRQNHLKRLVWALNGLKKPSSSSSNIEGDEAQEVPGSSRNIRLAVYVSLAMTKNRAAWSQALMNRISSDQNNRPTLRKILGPRKFKAIIAQRARYQSRLILQSKLRQAHMQQHNMRCKKLQISRHFSSRRSDPGTSSQSGLVRRRTKQLQGLVPGGKSMETSCFLREAADYIVSLKTQVEVLQSLVNSVDNNQQQ